MKVIIILLGVVGVGFIIVQLFAMNSRNKIETYPYKVEETYDGFEIRLYEASLFTSVKLPTNQYEQASGRGFSMLAGYIFGGNDKKQKIAMTSPVAMSLEDSMTMMFMVPSAIKKDDLPKPDQAGINFNEEPEKRVAAIRFGGWANTDRIDAYKEQLKKALDAEGIAYTNRFFYLGYNPPYDVVNRKNEVIVELSADK